MGPPRGRPRKDSDWVDGVGWVTRESAGTVAPQRSVVRTVVALPVVQAIDKAEVQRLREQREQERLAAEEEARAAQEEATRVKRARLERVLKEAADRERLQAPRRYALNVQSKLARGESGTPPPVYYFDANGNFRELGKEPESKLTPTMTPIRKKKRHCPRRVGPCETKSGWLSQGESEYISD